MDPPSVTEAAEASSTSVVGSLLSVTVVVAVEAVSTASKLPPVVPVIDTTVSTGPCTWTSSGRTATAALEAELAPTGMETVWPLDSVTSSGEPVTGPLTATVYEIEPPSATVAADGVTVTTATSASSVTVVVAVAVVLTASKLPPVLPVMDTTVSAAPWA
ncbi:hypothetical protein ASC87_21470 [Rhizobacter sp. Root1221]|nr:hypothetical protein ASC87_21470 [Rhizobacter sp. Root1221]